MKKLILVLAAGAVGFLLGTKGRSLIDAASVILNRDGDGDMEDTGDRADGDALCESPRETE